MFIYSIRNQDVKIYICTKLLCVLTFYTIVRNTVVKLQNQIRNIFGIDLTKSIKKRFFLCTRSRFY